MEKGKEEHLTVVTEQGMFGELDLEDPNERIVDNKKKKEKSEFMKKPRKEWIWPKESFENW